MTTEPAGPQGQPSPDATPGLRDGRRGETTAPPPASDDQIAEQVAAATRALAAAGQADLVWGHLAHRDPAGRGYWIKAAGLAFEETTAETVLLLDWDGAILRGSARAHAEHPLHGGVFRRRADVNWTVHTHSPSVNAFSALGVPLRALSHDAVPFVVPPLPRFRDGNLITTGSRGAAVADTIGGHVACLLPAHGSLCLGSTAAEAVMRTVLLARACALHLTAVAAGGPARWSDDDEVRAKQFSCWPAGQYDAGYAYLLRRARRMTCGPS